MSWVDAFVAGALLGGVYALLAAGLALVVAVMGAVDLAHGHVALLGTFLAWTIGDVTGVDPVLNLALVVPVMFAAGYALQLGVVDRVMPRVDPLGWVVVTLAAAVIIQNGLVEVYSDEERTLDPGVLDGEQVVLAGRLTVEWPSLARFAASVALIGLLHLLLTRTPTGRLLRAGADDGDAATLFGVDPRRMRARAMGLAAATAAVAGVFVGMGATFGPADGPVWLIFAFEALIIGGLGTWRGAVVGGVVLGVAQAIGAEVSPGWGELAGHLVFVVVLAVRPAGLVRTAGAASGRGARTGVPT
ncbi:MAG: branched-chain amino acid ABC transporter permease [Actinomycetota bacterium]|nr:branched-chain amino acid ABC transporter permease [Actinomycetota bacterium]